MAARGGIYVKGEVLETTRRNGTTNGRDWSFTIVAVLVGRNVVELTYSTDRSEGPEPTEGQVIDVECTYDTNRKQFTIKRPAAGVAAVKAS